MYGFRRDADVKDIDSHELSDRQLTTPFPCRSGTGQRVTIEL